MPSLGSILSVASSALSTQQAAMEVTSHNIANVNTEGYARQRADMSANTPLATPHGIYGTGVGIQDVARLADRYAEDGQRTETGLAERHQARATLLDRLEMVLGEPGEEGLAGALDRFFSSWSELSSDPGDRVARSLVLESGERLAGELNRLSGELRAAASDAEARIGGAVTEANGLSTEVARLNREIVAAEAGGQTAGDLRDARTRALNELAGLVPVEVIQRDNGSVGVAVDGSYLVDGVTVRELSTSLSPGAVDVQLSGSGAPLTLSGGAIRGYQDVLNVDLPRWTARLDDLAGALVSEVNAVHAGGTSATGVTGVDYFDAAGVTAGSIRLSAAVAGDPDAVAAGTGTSDPTPLHRPGANDVALSLAGLRDRSVGALGATFGDTVAGVAADLGGSLRRARESAEVHGTLQEQWTLRRESVSGVSVDEELVQLVKFQSAYKAAARVVTTADEMLSALLNM